MKTTIILYINAISLLTHVQIYFQNSDLFWKPSVAVLADVGGFMTLLAKGLEDYKCDEAWLQSLRVRDSEKEKANRYAPKHGTSYGFLVFYIDCWNCTIVTKYKFSFICYRIINSKDKFVAVQVSAVFISDKTADVSLILTYLRYVR